MPWLTPDDAIGQPQAYRVFLPNNQLMEDSFCGAFLDLTSIENWEAWGSTTPQECVDAWQECYDKTFPLRKWCPVIGSVQWLAFDTPPDNMLVCDGASYDTDDYPDLFAAIGYTFGGSGTSFNVPNIVDRVISGAGSVDSLGDTGGQATVTLTTSQMPAHTHALKQTVTPVGGAVVLPVMTASAIPLFSTESAGSGQSHENRPPYIALTPCIVAS